jgi:hypothetical protein
MATTAQHVQASFKLELETGFESLQQQRTALLEEFRAVQLAARVLMVAEARRLAAEDDADDPRPARLIAAGDAIARRVAALDIESQISLLRVAPAPRVEATPQGAAGESG